MHVSVFMLECANTCACMCLFVCVLCVCVCVCVYTSSVITLYAHCGLCLYTNRVMNVHAVKMNHLELLFLPVLHACMQLQAPPL